MDRLSDRWMYYSGMLAAMGVRVEDLKVIDGWIEAVEDERLLFYSDAIPLVEEAPTVDAAPVVHGKWIRTHNGDGWNDWYDLECPVCGEYYRKPNFKENFCPNCGAKMDGAE